MIRHASHEDIGSRLSGRLPNLALSMAGRAEAETLARGIAAEMPDAIQSSPVLRARQTAEAVADACGHGVGIADALEEVDFGDWTGRYFDDLEGDPDWDFWNTHRSQASTPSGESMKAAQDRVRAHVAAMARDYRGKTLVMVTHCDIIRALVAAILGLTLDNILRFDVGPASVTRVEAGDWGARLTRLNERFA
ncbi:histidine phosphatase family protein [Altererythrobacter sp. SALINAS58]|uniref:histidine phosphatase family protein n=1 Tax=Alteripontixanthobacter muriae TaxID=2705546 RepID=UPI001576EB3F|nr:histidine phosphatase family protein [Alteripontixanthobacter muriae]NTZ43639.1 histidine phosphatase family protein [Alteripontixanthobacter muriae]